MFIRVSPSASFESFSVIIGFSSKKSLYSYRGFDWCRGFLTNCFAFVNQLFEAFGSFFQGIVFPTGQLEARVGCLSVLVAVFLDFLPVYVSHSSRFYIEVFCCEAYKNTVVDATKVLVATSKSENCFVMVWLVMQTSRIPPLSWVGRLSFKSQ